MAEKRRSHKKMLPLGHMKFLAKYFTMNFLNVVKQFLYEEDQKAEITQRKDGKKSGGAEM